MPSRCSLKLVGNLHSKSVIVVSYGQEKILFTAFETKEKLFLWN